MDKEDPCPFPLPIKVELSEHENVDNCGGAWQAKESFPKLRLVRMPKSKQRPARSNVNKSRKIKRISTESPLPIQLMNATEMKDFDEFRTTFKNNIDRTKADYEKKVTQLMAKMDEKVRRVKFKKWCFICQKEVTFDCDLEPSVCSTECLKVMLTRDGYLNEPSSTTGSA